ncbi:hypothetical protein M514_28211, partial [Trichuris suis]
MLLGVIAIFVGIIVWAVWFMEGGIPVLVVSDLEMLNDILIKKFNCFHARKLTYVDFHEGGLKRIHMFLANGLRWKRLRSVSAPAFSTVRLKQELVNNHL